jgi:hypothetical protein
LKRPGIADPTSLALRRAILGLALLEEAEYLIGSSRNPAPSSVLGLHGCLVSLWLPEN